MSASQNNAAQVANSSFAQTLINQTVLPAYQKQLQDGITSQGWWKKFGYFMWIVAQFLTIVSTIMGSINLYNGNQQFVLYSVILNACSHGTLTMSHWAFTEEKNTAVNNNAILTAVGANIQMSVPDDDQQQIEVSQAQASQSQAAANNV